nr:scythe:bat3 [Hymenolepis microstoma]
MFEVSIKTLDGESKTFQIEDEELTVSSFKEKISSEMNIPIDRQRLIFQGKILTDDRKLKDWDVASKTIHLVPRPPPQPGNEAGPSTTGDESQPSRLSFGSIPLHGFSNAMNTIFQSFTPPAATANPAISAHRLFNNLQRQSNNLLNNIDGEVASESTPTISPNESQTMTSDPTNSQSENSGLSSEQPSQQETPTVDFVRLADMVAEQRSLWQRLSPHLDQWEAMLRAEQERREANRTSDSHSDPPSSDLTEPMETESTTPRTSVEWSDTFFNNVSSALHLHAHMLHLFSDFLVEQEGHRRGRSTSSGRSSSSVPNQPATSDSQSTLSTSNTRNLYIREPSSSILHAHINIEPTVVTIARPVVNVTGDIEVRRRSQSAHPPAPSTDTTATTENGTTSTTNTSADTNTTPPGRTNEERRALHLHAHMLHLFSDFLVEQEGHRRGRSTSSGRSSSSVPNQPATSDSQSTLSTSNTRNLYIREPSSSILHAHINIEPTVVTIARPVVNVTGDIEVRRRSQSAHPPAPSTDTTATTENGTTSTTNTSADTNTTPPGRTNEERRVFEIPTAVVFDTPLLGGGQTGGNLTSQLLETIYSQFGQAIPVNIGSNQTPTTNTGVNSNTTPATARRRFNIRNMASSGMTNLLPPAAFLSSPPSRNDGDIFLPCGSRHSFGGRRPRSVAPPVGRRGSLVSSVIGSNFRMGRSTETPQTANATTAASTQGRSQSQATSQPLDTVRSLMEMASGQLNQILAEFGVANSNGHGGGASTQSSTAANLPNSASNAVPSFGFPQPAFQRPLPMSRGDYPVSLFPGILIEGLIRLVWSAIYRIALSQIPDSLPSLPIDDWERGVPAYLFHPFADDRPIRPLFESLISYLSPLGDIFNATTDFLHAVDLARLDIHNFVNENLLSEVGSDSMVRPELINVLLNSFPTDESNFSSPDNLLFRWATSRAVEVGNEPLDIRQSLLFFFQDSLSRQLPLWRANSREDGVLGNVLLNSLEVFMFELFAFCHLLVQRGAEALGLQLNSVSNEVDPVSATFGYSLSLAPLMSLILHHYDLLLENGGDETAIDLLIHGMDHVRNTFPSSGITRFNENRERWELCLRTRSLPASTLTYPVATTDSTEEDPRQEGPRNPPAVIDDDVSDVYMDANEESPNSAQPVNGEAPNNATPGIFPNWDSPGIPLSTADTLAPNPLSTWNPTLSPSVYPPVPDAFPPEWAGVVASDVVQMRASTDTAKQENDISDESTPSVRRLSDAYVSGMPVKRRRVMLDRKHNFTNSTNDMFINLLKEAMSSQIPIASPAGPVEIENDGDVVAAAEEVMLPLSQVAPPQHVSEAFRAYITEHLSRRLANDPDFDAERHSAAEQVFRKRSSPSSSSDKRQ